MALINICVEYIFNFQYIKGADNNEVNGLSVNFFKIGEKALD